MLALFAHGHGRLVGAVGTRVLAGFVVVVVSSKQATNQLVCLTFDSLRSAIVSVRAVSTGANWIVLNRIGAARGRVATRAVSGWA